MLRGGWLGAKPAFDLPSNWQPCETKGHWETNVLTARLGSHYAAKQTGGQSEAIICRELPKMQHPKPIDFQLAGLTSTFPVSQELAYF